MEPIITQLSLYVLTGWVWVWLTRVTHRDLPRVIYVQQRIGLSTAWPLHWLAWRSRLLMAGGVASALTIGLLPGPQLGATVGLLGVGLALLTYLYIKMARFLDQRIVDSILRPHRGEEPDEPFPVA